MSNLNDFVNANPTKYIQTTWINNAFGTGHADYNETNQSITLHSDTRLIKIRNGSAFDVNIAYSYFIVPTI